MVCNLQIGSFLLRSEGLVLCRYSKYPKSKTLVAKAIIKAPKPADPTNWLEDREVPELVMVEVGFGAGNTHTTTLTMFVILFAMSKCC